MLTSVTFYCLMGFLLLFGLLITALDLAAAFELMNAMICALSVGVVVSFSEGARDIVRLHPRYHKGGDILILGVFVLWNGLMLTFIFLWGWRVTGDPWYLNNPWVAFSRWLIVIGGCMHMAAGGAVGGMVPSRAYVRAGVIAGFGVLVAMLLLTLGVGTSLPLAR